MRKQSTCLLTAVSLMVIAGGMSGCTHIEIPNPFAPKPKPAAVKPTNKNVIVYKLHDLDNRVADHSSPDAMVYIAPGFDSDKPIHLVVYNHGMMTNLNDVEQTWKLSEAMKHAAPNTVMVAPEWAVRPKELSAAAGPFHKPGFFRGMLQEILSKTPELKTKTIDKDIQSIALTSFSGGLYALVSELEKNDLEDKITSVTLFDSLYKGFVLDNWLKKNIKELASGEKQYYNFYFHTWPATLQQIKRVKKMLAESGVESSATRFDTDDAHTVLNPDKIAPKGILYKYTMAGIDKNWIGHNAVPKVYFPQFLKAMAIRQSGAVQLATQESPDQQKDKGGTTVERVM